MTPEQMIILLLFLIFLLLLLIWWHCFRRPLFGSTDSVVLYQAKTVAGDCGGKELVLYGPKPCCSSRRQCRGQGHTGKGFVQRDSQHATKSPIHGGWVATLSSGSPEPFGSWRLDLLSMSTGCGDR